MPEQRGLHPAAASAALYPLRTEAKHPERSPYGHNQAVSRLLRYGVPVKTEAGKVTEAVPLIHWKQPTSHHFARAEEVALKGKRERRPDLVLYVNGLALGVLELKNRRVHLREGIRASLSSPQPEFNAWFAAPCSGS